MSPSHQLWKVWTSSTYDRPLLSFLFIRSLFLYGWVCSYQYSEYLKSWNDVVWRTKRIEFHIFSQITCCSRQRREEDRGTDWNIVTDGNKIFLDLFCHIEALKRYASWSMQHVLKVCWKRNFLQISSKFGECIEFVCLNKEKWKSFGIRRIANKMGNFMKKAFKLDISCGDIE